MFWRKRRNFYIERKSRSRLRQYSLLCLLLAAMITAVFIKLPRQEPSPAPPLQIPYTSKFAQTKQYRATLRKAVHRVRRGDNFYQILANHGVPPQEIAELASVSKSERDPQRMRTGELVELFFHQDSRRLEKVRLHDRNDRVLTMGRAAWGWVTGVYTKPSVVVSAFAQGTIRDSLYQSAQNEGVPFELAMALADIFAWDIDFFVDLRPDDRYAFLYEQIYQNGRTVGNGRIIAAHFFNAGVHHRAYYYEVSGKGSDYYDTKGNSLRRQFLKSPLRYSRISSGFSKRRLHPILKIYRPHLGIDYAAPTNTPVVAVGDGRVISIGWKNGYGRFIAIRHSNRFTTTYGHLSRYTRGLKMGHSVKQGQVIGFVGASGLATGPHLDFRMKRDGRFVNPLKVRLPAAQPLPRTLLADFQQLVSSLEDKLGRALARDQWGESDPLASLTVAHD